MEREIRYTVIKHIDAVKYLNPVEMKILIEICAKISSARSDDGKPQLDCVVVERDWPEYEPTWMKSPPGLTQRKRSATPRPAQADHR